jgi:ABC-type polysaccharide/polyol phosphate export permease
LLKEGQIEAIRMNVENVVSERMVIAAEGPSIPDAAIHDSLIPRIFTELVAGFSAWRIWVLLAWDDIRQRYRRSIIGPFWITLSMAIFIFVLGIIYSQLFHTDLKTYLPFLSTGFIIWGFISSSTQESCLAFHDADRIIKQIKLPYSVYVLRVVCRNLIIFLHTIVIFVPVSIFFKLAPHLVTLVALPGLCLVVVNIFWVAIVLAIVSTRYRDIQPIVSTTVQLAMFATPIMWPANSLGDATLVAEINPIYHLIELVRQPMLGAAPEVRSWLVAGGLAIAGSGFAVWLLTTKSRRIVHWL